MIIIRIMIMTLGNSNSPRAGGLPGLEARAMLSSFMFQRGQPDSAANQALTPLS